MRFVALLLLATLVGCGTIEHHETPAQAVDQTLVAGVGDVVLKIERTKDLPNVVGKADMWGRTTPTGHIEVRFLGVEPDGSVVFARRDVEIISNDTTVSRMGFVPVPTTTQSTASGFVGNTAFSGTSTTTGTSYVPTQGARMIAVPSGSVPIKLPPGQQSFRVAGMRVQVLDAQTHEIAYRITRLDSVSAK